MPTFLALFFFLLPFQFALSPLPGIDLPVARLLVIILFLVWLFSGLKGRSLTLPNPQILWPTLFFLVWLVLSSLWALQPDWAWRKSAFLFNFFLLLFPLLAVFSREGQKTRYRITAALVSGATLSGIMGSLQFLSQFVFGLEKTYTFWTSSILPFFLGQAFGASVREYPSLLVNVSDHTLLRASGFFPDPHLFGLYSATALFLAIWLWRSSGKRFWLFFGSILLLATLLSFSRGAYLALFCGTIVLTFPALKQYFSLRRIFFVLLLSGLLVFSPIGNRLLSSFSQNDGSVNERLRLWEEAADHISERPLGGVGLGSYPLLVDPQALYRTPIYAHNLYLDVWAEIGLVGLLPLLFLFLIALRQRTSEYGEAPRAALVVFLVHSFFETPLFSVHCLPLLLFLLAFLLAPPPSMNTYESDPLS
ncbi:MAG: O-antigen ligase family protein [Candidatus Moraniibacteriota bacterium]